MGGPACKPVQEHQYVMTAMKELSHNCHDVKLIWNFIATSHGKGQLMVLGPH